MSANSEPSNAYSIQGYNLVTLLKRLEAATSRLEDVTVFQEEAAGKHVAPALGSVETVSSSSATTAASAGAIEANQAESKSTPVAEATETPKQVLAFDNFIADNLTPFLELSKEIDPIVGEAVENFVNAFVEERKFLLAVSKSKKVANTDPAFANALNPINKEIEKIIKVKDENRQSKSFSHLSTLAEGSPVLGWVVMNTPVSFIPDYKDAAQFWANRIMKDYKESDPKQVEWAKSFLSIFDSLKNYVKEYHATGPSWNPQGGSLEDALKADSSEPVASSKSEAAPPTPAAAAGGAAPPPPPPPPPPASIFETDSEPKSETGMNAVFSALNQGENITKGLKKVDKSQMTHKNPELRSSSTVPAPPASKKPVPPKKPTSLSQKPTKKPAKMELVDTKWVIENIEDNHELVIENGEMHQSVFIAKCNNVTIQIKGKVNAISLNECNKVALVVDSLVSGIDVIKCIKFGIQVLNTTPLISIDQSDGGQIYLAKTSMNTDIFTSSTTALNVNVPDDELDGDFKEVPVPEQFKHTFDANGKMTSSIVEHAG